MKVADFLLSRARHLHPGYFALVMATGIVSIDFHQHGMYGLARVLFGLNALAWSILIVLTGSRLLRFRKELIADFTHPARGAGFLTLTAGTCILGIQCLTLVHWPEVARILVTIGALSWAALLYLFFAATITARIKPGFTRSINGGWLVAVVATQSLTVLMVLLSADATDGSPLGLFVALCLYLIGAALYLLIITLVVYRMMFFPMRAREFTPPYWINMGALAITTLAGSLLVMHIVTPDPLYQLVPFVKGFTLFFWATASWWIPLLVMLEIWRHLWRHVPLRYEVDNWDIVFPLGMYTVGTWQLSHALDLPYLQIIPVIGVYVSGLVWLWVATGAVTRAYRGFRLGGRRHTPP